MDQQSESPSLQQQWIDQRIQEAVNATLSPLQDQLSLLMEQLGRAQPQSADLQSPPSTPGLGTPSQNLRYWNAETVAQPTQMRDKLDLDAHYYSGNRELWYLINSCLDERPQQLRPQEFMRYLDRTYQDSNIQSRAAATLRTMRQREDQPLASFLPRFEQALAEAGGADWPDSAKIVFLENAINARLQESLVTAVLPDDYQGWLARVQEIAGRLERLKPADASTATKATTQEEPEDPDGDVKMTDINRIGHESKGRRHVDKKPKDERRCYRCGLSWRRKQQRPKAARMKKPDAADDSESTAASSEDESAGKTSPGRKRAPGPAKADIRDWEAFKPRMNSRTVLVNARVNRGYRIRALVDCGCDCYAVIDEALVRKLRIPFVDSKPREIGDSQSQRRVSYPQAGFDERVFAYVIPSLGQDMFLGRPWMERNHVVYDAAKQRMYHGRAGVTIRLIGQEEPAKIRAIRSARLVSAAVFTAECRRAKRRKKCNAISIHAISLSDIERALQPKPPVDPSEKVPAEVLKEFRDLFSPGEAMKLPPH
ncbi:transposon Tf2-3 polyprotein [Hirsutella rhossiliensis]